METRRTIRRQFNNLTTGESENNSLRLPEELVEEILSKLPATSLLKFRCVSKSWRSLIDSERFIKSHHENTNRSTSFTHRNIILNPRTEYRTHYHFSLHSLFNEPATNSFEFNHDSLHDIYKPVVVGCCNGLICFLSYSNHLYLWNPCTRMSKKLPDFGGDRKNYIKRITRYGFGFDGDYKVFLSVSMFRGGFGYHITEKVYSLKTNSWKLVNGYEDVSTSQYYGAGKLASGNLHWAMKSGSNFGWVIRSFDLKNQSYGTVEQPNYTKGGFGASLGVVEGCLCVICNYQSHLDIWSLKEYGVKESWNILLRVPSIPYVDIVRQGFSIVPLCVGPNKEILLYYGSIFVIYYPKGNWFGYPKIHNIYDDDFEAEVYVESLVSLVSDGDQQD